MDIGVEVGVVCFVLVFWVVNMESGLSLLKVFGLVWIMFRGFVVSKFFDDLDGVFDFF